LTLPLPLVLSKAEEEQGHAIPTGGAGNLCSSEMGAGEEAGYPMSTWLRGHGLALPASARELATHSAEEWTQRRPPQLFTHGFRALLEPVLEARRTAWGATPVQVGRLMASKP
jgi:hypothetical protein